MSVKKIRLTEEFCELIRVFIGDGYLGKYSGNQYIFGISGDKTLDEDYLKNHIVGLIRKVFPDVTPRLYYRSDENTLMLRVNSKELFLAMIDLGFVPGKKARSVKIPQQILTDDKLMNATVRGIFDTDGCLFLDRRPKYRHPYPRLTIQLASVELIEQLEKYLSKKYALYVNKSNRDGYRNYVEIYRKVQVQSFLKEVGISNKRHLAKMPL